MHDSQELELLTVQFLREHDQFFYCKRQLTYPYHSHRTTKERASKEIPGSGLSKKQMKRCPKMLDIFDSSRIY